MEAVTSFKTGRLPCFRGGASGKSIPLQEFSFGDSEKIAVIFGNEVTGVDAEVVQKL